MGKPRFNEQKHEELGLELAIMYDRLISISVEVHNAYPQTNNAYKAATLAVKQLFKLRSDLEEELFADSRSATTNVYFPDLKYPRK